MIHNSTLFLKRKLLCSGLFLLWSFFSLASVQAQSLTLNVTPIPDPPQPGQVVTYTATVSNRSLSSITNVLLTDIVPTEGISFFFDGQATDEGDCIGSSCDPGELITWNLGTLGAGQSVTKTVQMPVLVSAVNGTLIHNRFQLTATGQSQQVLDYDRVVDNRPVLRLSLNEDREPVEPGSFLTYTLTFANQGVVNTANVSLQATVPSGTTFISASDNGSFAGGVITWPLGTVIGGRSGE